MPDIRKARAQTLRAHCDWLTLRQTHDIGHASRCPVFMEFDPDTGEKIKEGRRPVMVKGAYKSNAQIYSDGQTTELDWNPSRHNRGEAVFGLTVEEAIAKSNQFMEANGLPPFTPGELLERDSDPAKEDPETYLSGAAITRLDITTNLMAGEHIRTALAYAKSVTIGKREQRIRETSVEFGQNEYRVLKFYDKGEELKAKNAPDRVAEWCKVNGVLRAEARIGSKALKDLNMRRIDVVTQEKAVAELEKEIAFMKQIEVSDLKDVPDPYLGTLTKWMLGIDVARRLSPATYYRHKKVLKEHGYDISGKVMPMKAVKHVITLEVAEPPDWYEGPEGPDVPITGRLKSVE